MDIRPSILLEDSKGIRLFFYYRDSSIYYREVSVTGDTKDTMLISQANGDFSAAAGSDDTIYLTCNSRYKGVLLFTYSNNGWKFEPVMSLHNSSNMYIMDTIVLNGSVHIFFSKKLPIANLYNVYHIQKNISEHMPYLEYSWRKNSLSEIYSQNIETSYSILPSKGDIIHYASVWYDGIHYFINYYCYDDSIKSWIQKNLNISYKNQVFVKLIYHNKRINLFCFSNDKDGGHINHFQIKSSGASEIEFKELSNTLINTGGAVPLFYSDEKSIQLAWVKDNIFHQYAFDDSSAKWKKIIDLPVTADDNLHVIKTIRSSVANSASKGYFFLDKDYNIARPVEHKTRSITEDKPKEKPKDEAAPETNDYLKQILCEIKNLSENVQGLRSRIDNLEGRNLVNKGYWGEPEELLPPSPITTANEALVHTSLNKSSFKEKFMKNEKTPNYDNLAIKQENITTFIGKPPANKNTGDTPQEAKAKDEPVSSEKQAYITPDFAGQDGTPYRSNGLIKKLGEFFK